MQHCVVHTTAVQQSGTDADLQRAVETFCRQPQHIPPAPYHNTPQERSTPSSTHTRHTLSLLQMKASHYPCVIVSTPERKLHRRLRYVSWGSGRGCTLFFLSCPSSFRAPGPVCHSTRSIEFRRRNEPIDILIFRHISTVQTKIQKSLSRTSITDAEQQVRFGDCRAFYKL